MSHPIRKDAIINLCIWSFLVLNNVYGCPKSCRCTTNSADCSNQNLTVTTIPKLPDNITHLILSGNNFTNLTDDAFQHLSKIESLELNNCTIRYLYSGTFRALKSIKYLDFSHNHIKKLKYLQAGLDGLNEAHQLQILNISYQHGGFPNLTNSLFRNMENTTLSELVLRGYRLKNVTGSTFTMLSHLQTLDLSNNEITTIDFKGFPRIQNLNLTHNELASLPQLCNDEESLLPNLTQLRIAINHLSNSFEFNKQGHCLPELVYLNLSFNAMNRLKSMSFVRLAKLKKLRLQNILTYDLFVEQNAFNSTSLEYLYLGGDYRIDKNDFNYQDIFRHNPNLRKLELSNFKFRNFTAEEIDTMLSPLTKLEKLKMSHASLQSVPNLKKFPNLTSLNLQGNHIRHFDAKDFEHSNNLTKISFRKNQLAVVNEDMFPEHIWTMNNLSLDLSYNPYACDCELEWFRNWIESNKEKLILYPDDYQCDSPSKWKKRHLQEYQPHLSGECHPVNHYIVMTSILSSFVFIFIFIVFLLRKFRWDIKYYLHNCGCCFRHHSGYERIQDSSDVIYDAFVAYNSIDRKWIMSELVRYLENKNNYKLCLHERNFIPGQPHVDNILDNIDVSRKLILVLSNNFMEDQWCKYETAIANHQVANGNGDKIILILLEEIKAKHMSNSLKTLLKSIDNIEWTLNLNGRKLFWDKLKQLLEK